MKKWYQDLWAILTRSELWVTVAIILTAIYEGGMFPPESAVYKFLSLALAVLAALGYTVSRTYKKVQEIKNANSNPNISISHT